jgi:uncharacterized protein (UPF0210 family)
MNHRRATDEAITCKYLKATTYVLSMGLKAVAIIIELANLLLVVIVYSENLFEVVNSIAKL